MSAGGLVVRRLGGADVVPYLGELARLRTTVFRDWPYLYDGDAAYEREYLETYARSRESLFVLASDGEAIVGASTAVPLADEVEAFQRPFRDAGIDPATVFYFGESVLLPEYRGRGLGHRFFDEREARATQLGRFGCTAFCAVVRDPADPRRPAGYRPLDPFWTQRGYVRHDDMRATLAWKEVGDTAASSHQLAFWLRTLEA